MMSRISPEQVCAGVIKAIDPPNGKAMNPHERLGKSKLAAAVSHWSRPGSDGVSGSFSALHTSGVNATFAAGSHDFTARGRLDSTFRYAKLGLL